MAEDSQDEVSACDAECDCEESQEKETFYLELDAGQLHSMNLLFSYLSVDVDDFTYSQTALSLQQEVSEVMASERFNRAFENEIESATEEFQDFQNQFSVPNMPEPSGHGVQ